MKTLFDYCEKICDSENSPQKNGEWQGGTLIQNHKVEDDVDCAANIEDGMSNQLYAASYFGVNPEMIDQLYVNYPPNFSCLPSGKPRVVEEDSQIQRFPIDIVRYGWKKTYKTTSIAIHWLRMAQHRAHQIPTEGHHLY